MLQYFKFPVPSPPEYSEIPSESPDAFQLCALSAQPASVQEVRNSTATRVIVTKWADQCLCAKNKPQED